jgi:predicted DNA-binding protein with PD1-like motif
MVRTAQGGAVTMTGQKRRRLRHGLQTLWSAVRLVLFTGFAIVSAVGILRAWTIRGTVDDRRAELTRLQYQLVEQQLRGEDLHSHLAAFRSRSDVRMQAIRGELGMLRDNERFFVFK